MGDEISYTMVRYMNSIYKMVQAICCLYTIYYILYTIYYILYTIYYILYTIYYNLFILLHPVEARLWYRGAVCRRGNLVVTVALR